MLQAAVIKLWVA